MANAKTNTTVTATNDAAKAAAVTAFFGQSPASNTTLGQRLARVGLDAVADSSAALTAVAGAATAAFANGAVEFRDERQHQMIRIAKRSQARQGAQYDELVRLGLL